MNFYKLSVLLLSVSVLSACSQSSYDDLTAFMAEKKARPAGRIDPVPSFKPYRPFDYSAANLRAPFDRPIAAKDLIEIKPSSNVKPDTSRPKEFLENFNLESLQMVGTIKQKGQLWALIDDGQGSVHYVKDGDHLGRNYGQIISVTPTFIQLVEIVPAGGTGGWVKRPRTLDLREK